MVHCHLLFHLPVEYRAKRKLQVEAAIIASSSGTVAVTGPKEVIDLRIHDNTRWQISHQGRWPENLETLSTEEGASPPARHHRGKRCGTTQNLGPAVRPQALMEGNNRTAEPVA